MSTYLSRTWVVFGGCVVAVFLGGPSCASGGEDVGALHQPLLCQSVDVCDDENPCTDDLCVANLCVNLPLVNCSPGCAGGGAGGDGGGVDRGGKSGSSGGTAGTSPVATDGGADDAGNGSDVGGMSNGRSGVSDAGGTSGAGHATTSNGATAAAAGEENGPDGATDANAWRMQGGGCTLSAGTRPSRESTAWALLGLLVVASTARRRRQRPRA